MSEGPGDQPQPPEWQQPQWQQPQPEPPQWGAQQPQWGQPQQPYYYQAGPQTPGAATAALILGICSLILCPLCAPFAIFYGSSARKDIDPAGGRLTGRGLGTAGIVMGWFAVALTALFIIVLLVTVVAVNNSGS